MLFLTAGLSAVVLLFLPGAETEHWRWVVGFTLVCSLWASYCFFLARPEEHGSWFWHTPAIGAVLLIGGVIAATGGASSPARFYLFFLLVYACYFFSADNARPYALACVAVALTPLLYDPDAITGGYVGEVLVLCPAYVLLGGLIIKGKAQLVTLREQAHSLALRDPLTELANRRAMIEWLCERMGTESSIGLLLLDLDGFKDVNTAHGYPAGDAVLRETARTLERAVRPEDLVARLGGDEFAALVPGADTAAMCALSRRLLDALRGMEVRLELDEVRLTASVGWVLYPADADSIDDLIGAADFCLRGAKLTGKDRALSAVDWAIEAA